jgi:hypothetical protein
MRQHLQMKFATLVIVLVLGLQSAAVVLMAGPSGWPFTDYPMYSRSHHEGERVSGARYFVYATASDGREVDILPEHLGVNIWLFGKWAKQLTVKPRGRGSMSEAHSPEPTMEPVKSKSLLRSLRERLHSSRNWLHSLSENKANLNSLFLPMLEQKLGIHIVRLRVEDTPFVVTRHGMAPTSPNVVLVNIGSHE